MPWDKVLRDSCDNGECHRVCGDIYPLFLGCVVWSISAHLISPYARNIISVPVNVNGY